MQARAAEYKEQFEKAYGLYSQAKELGSVLATHALGAYHENGYYLNKDIDKARKLYIEAAASHSTSALNALG